MDQGWTIRKVRGSDGNITFRQVFFDEIGRVLEISQDPFFAAGKTSSELLRDVDLQFQAYALGTLNEDDDKTKAG